MPFNAREEYRDLFSSESLFRDERIEGNDYPKVIYQGYSILNAS